MTRFGLGARSPKIQKLRKNTEFCENLQRTFANFCEHLHFLVCEIDDVFLTKIYRFLRKSVGGWTEAFLDFCANAEENMMLSFLDFRIFAKIRKSARKFAKP